MSIQSSFKTLAQPVLPAPGPEDNKYTRGLVVVVGGVMPGAGALTALAAARSGAGYVIHLGGDPNASPHAIVRRSMSALTETVVDPRVNAVVVGPGLGRDPEAHRKLDVAIASGHPLVIDADALSLMGTGMVRNCHQAVILTPHAGEFERLFGNDEAGRVERARSAAASTGAVVILKGSETVIAAPDGRCTQAPPASAWLSTAGTGDVLAGIAATMLAQLKEPFDAACAAVWLHGDAARRAGPALIADDLLTHLAAARAACL
jgi:ADP-dependent NAD(P)H-hydrate dehydratase / NAD(P)H-hydrate epimerase